MKRSFYSLLVLSVGGMLVQLAGSLCTAYGAEVPSLDEIIQKEKQFIDSRKAIRTGRVVVSNRVTKFDRDPSQENVEKRYSTYFQGNKIRADSEIGNHREQLVFTPDTRIRAFSDMGTVNVFDPNSRSKDSLVLPDPRRLGIVVWFYATMNSEGYEGIFLNPNRSHFRVEAGTDGDEPIWKVSFQVLQKNRLQFVEYWLSDRMGGLPLFVAVRTGKGEMQSFKSIRSKLKDYGSNHVWFPSEVIVRLGVGERTTMEEVITVEDAVFGEDIPGKMFTVAGLGLPEGKLVDIDGKLMTWDGERLVRDSIFRNSKDEKLPQSRAKLLPVLISILLALIAVCLWRQRAKRRQAS
jgi:hypothetical protein